MQFQQAEAVQVKIGLINKMWERSIVQSIYGPLVSTQQLTIQYICTQIIRKLIYWAIPKCEHSFQLQEHKIHITSIDLILNSQGVDYFTN